MKVMVCASVVSLGFCASIFLPAGSAHADLCPYPGIGSGGGALFAQGGFCDYPTEINGSHMHCEAGGFGVNGIIGQATRFCAPLGARAHSSTGGEHRHSFLPRSSYSGSSPHSRGALSALLLRTQLRR